MNKFTKFISVMLAVILVVMAIPFTTFAATKGDVNGDNDVTAVDARLILQVVAGLKTEAALGNAAGADLNGDSNITAVDARIVLRIVAGLQDAPTEPETPDTPVTPETPSEPETPDTPVTPETPSEPETPDEPGTPDEPEMPETPMNQWTKADFATVFNTETAKAAKGTYKWARTCKYVKNLTASGVPVSAIQETVDKFLAIGTKKGNQSDAGKYALIAMNLTEDDIKNVQLSNGQITLILNDSAKPTVGGNTPFSHVSNDIVAESDAENEIKAAISSAKLTSFHTYYSNVKVTVFLNELGNPTDLTITYQLYAKLEAKAGVITAKGEGTVETKIEYTNLKY